jgi:hypothetical protein
MTQSPFYHYAASFDALGTISRFVRKDLVAHPDFLTNFLGVKISPRYFLGILDGKEGHIEPVPIPANWHADIAEWAYALHAVEMSNKTFTVVELGCGWGCWLNNTGIAAKCIGLDVNLIGIEGDAGHVAFAFESLQENGFSKSEYRIIHGIAGPTRSKALFPNSDFSGRQWGLKPIFGATEKELNFARKTGSHQVLETYPLSELSQGNNINLLHIDIQGGETDFVRASFTEINTYVHRMLIGTHSRAIEGDLQRFMLDKGWLLEMDRGVLVEIIDGKPETRVDGIQGWLNPKFNPSII